MRKLRNQVSSSHFTVVELMDKVAFFHMHSYFNFYFLFFKFTHSFCENGQQTNTLTLHRRSFATCTGAQMCNLIFFLAIVFCWLFLSSSLYFSFPLMPFFNDYFKSSDILIQVYLSNIIFTFFFC